MVALQESTRPKSGVAPRARRSRSRTTPAAGTRTRPWASVSWWYSLLFIVPACILAATWIVGSAGSTEHVSVQVFDQATGEPLSNVELAAGAVVVSTDDNGRVRLPVPDDGTLNLAASSPGYGLDNSSLTRNQDGVYTLAMQPTFVAGTITDAVSGEAVEGALISIAGNSAVSTQSGSDGAFRLEDVPAGSALHIEAGDYGIFDKEINGQTHVEIPVTRSLVTGQVVSASGNPLEGAVIQANGVGTVADADGNFWLNGAGDAKELTVSATGYGDVSLAIGAERVVNASLEEALIKAAYANQFTLTDPTEMDRLIELIDTTELNALVVDIKQDTIYYDSQVPFFTELDGVVVPLYDPVELLARLDELGIYSIARMVVFKDPLVAERRPDLAVTDENTGGSWRDYNGAAWVNAFYPELWDANIALALEAGELGFDEIQFDYVRFPSDGDLTTADFGPDYSAEAREGAITGFVERASEQIRPTGVKLAADLFAMIALQDNDQGIGQRLIKLAPLLDYICLMIYPSHYEAGNINSAPGAPNDYPYETVKETLERAEQLIPGTANKQRPWIQDFSNPVEGQRGYTAQDVAVQIQAAEEAGASGWMLWNPSNYFSVDALDPE